MKHKRNSLAGLLLAVLVLAGAVAMVGSHSRIGAIALLTVAAPFVFGAVTVNYEYPVQSTVAPTVSQMKPLSLVTAQVVFGADADTIALITHNMQMATIFLPGSTTAIAETSCLFPLASWYYTAGGSINTLLSGSIASSSVFQLTKASAASSAGTINFWLLRPWTGIR